MRRVAGGWFRSRQCRRCWLAYFVISLTLSLACSRMKTLDSVRVAFPTADGALHYDPAKIRFAHQYILLANLYSPLVEYSLAGELVSGLAERFAWKGTEARFMFRQSAVSHSGTLIDAYDAEASLKRLMILGENTHGDIAGLLCPGGLKVLSDPCPAMKVLDGGRILSLTFSKRLPFLFPMLAHIDFAVIPRATIDPKTLAIRDMRETSGPYFLESDDGGGRLVLRANPRHFHFDPAMPRKVRIVPVSGGSVSAALEMMGRGELDMVPAVGREPYEEKVAFSNAHPDVSIHETAPIHLAVAAFTGKGLRRLSLGDRRFVGRRLKEAFLRAHGMDSGFTPTDQILPPLGEGGIPESEASSFASKDDGGRKSLASRIDVWDLVPGGAFRNGDGSLVRALPGLRRSVVRALPGLVDYGAAGLREPDLYIMVTDVSGIEDVGLLSFYSKLDFFHLRGEAARKWLEGYVEIPEKGSRLDMLRALHRETLREFCAVPFAAQPYASLVKRPWSYAMPKIRVEEAFWRLRAP